MSTQHESKSLFFLDRKRYAKALVLIGRMFLTIQRRNLTDFIFEHENSEVALSNDEIEELICNAGKECEASPGDRWRQASSHFVLNMSKYYDLAKTNSLIESILNILTDNTKRNPGDSLIRNKNGILEQIGNRSLL